ncbi:AAA family ATPase [Alkalihalobacillus pseudalcaliphilus]|uniref:AAA family ATPase n=1 Tax=Alkalihalobacillus pseudalcaliphilus TaxID=79884 RepID=UPI00064D8C5F|nr:AAA family ATPase [Alkalihalobacillus pseudalcaliphilus]KMK75269.1 hypothetical protein AB990_17775 [Alkalihalobacillus pseudalcaliphilus]
MKILNLMCLKLTIDTVEGKFGSNVPFKKGFNVLRAKNTKGKSSIINSILYSLGIEELLGGKNAKTMKPALKDKLNYQDKELNVLESKVQLEFSNKNGEIITVTRWIKSESIDERLIRVHDGPLLTTEEHYNYNDFYVHLKGSAVENAGFHSYLAKFLGLELPKVPAFDGGDNLLYLQSLFPLFFIEQIKGWNSFYAPISGNFGIRDLPKRAFEYLLKMDVMHNTKEREALKLLRRVLANEWSTLKGKYLDLARSINAIVESLPDSPTLLENLTLKIYGKDNKPISLHDRIFELEESIKRKENLKINKIADVSDKYEEKINEQEVIVQSLQNEINSLRQELNLEQKNQRYMVDNLKNLEIDLKRNKEAEKLNRLGSNVDENFSKKICPTCMQKVEDTLMPMDLKIQPLELKENIRFVEEQIKTLNFGVKQSHNVIENRTLKLKALNTNLEKERRDLRLLKSELSENPHLPTKRELNYLVDSKITLIKMQEALSNFEKLHIEYLSITKRWRKYLSRLENLPKEYFSNKDKEKLGFFETEFKVLLTKFNYSSVKVSDISISHDKYTPIVSGFDIKFDSSASDSIRLIWSYIISLYLCCLEYNSNHVNLLVFDEPGQQQMDINSQQELFVALSNVKGQSIVGSSLTMKEVLEISRGLDVNIINLGDEYIIKPLQ